MSAAEVADADSFGFEQLEAPPEAQLPPRLGDVRAQAAALLAETERQANTIRASARAEGYQAGFAAGREAAFEELRPAAGALMEAVAGARELSLGAADMVEAEAVRLALQIADRVVASTLEMQPERVLDVLRGALRAVVERERLVIQVNPRDLELVRGAVAELSASLGGIEHVEVQEERRVERGGALVRTQVGEIDATIETKLQRARQAIEAELARP